MQLLQGVSLSSALALGGAAVADTYYVPDDFPTIQAAIDFVEVEGDEIIVRRGVYEETIDFLGKAIWLHSEEGRDVTTIDAGMPDPPMSVVKCVNGEGLDTILEGFTITGGTGTWFEWEGNDYLLGGGMFNVGSSPTVRACTFEGNEVPDSGGGMNNSQGSSPTVEDCIFRHNFAGASGGGMVNVENTSPTVRRCEFVENVAGEAGGGILDYLTPSSTIIDCVFLRNMAALGGGGLRIVTDDGATVTGSSFIENVTTTGSGGGIGSSLTDAPVAINNCTFIGNIAVTGGGVGTGPDTTVTNCTFGANEATWGGGISGAAMGTLRLNNCTFTQNDAGSGGAVFNPGFLDARNSVFWDDGGSEIWNGSEAIATVRYSDIEGGYEGVGNIDADPLCVDPANGDYRLLPGSPCIDAAANNAVPPDRYDLDDDLDTAERWPLDLDGKLRFADLVTKDDTGCGEPVVVDMGAYEFHGDPVHPVYVGDIDGDGFVAFADLLQLLTDWGECVEDCCLADLDFNEEVDFNDLLLLLANWS